MGDPNASVGGFERPTTTAGACSTPEDAQQITLLGGHRSEGVALTNDQFRHLESFYGFDFKVAGEEAVQHAIQQHEERLRSHQERMDDPDIPGWQKERERAPRPPSKSDKASLRDFAVTGASVNLWRALREDGVRVLALLSPYLEAGQDPVKLVLQLLSDVGYDVSQHNLDWVDGDE